MPRLRPTWGIGGGIVLFGSPESVVDDSCSDYNTPGCPTVPHHPDGGVQLAVRSQSLPRPEIVYTWYRPAYRFTERKALIFPFFGPPAAAFFLRYILC